NDLNKGKSDSSSSSESSSNINTDDFPVDYGNDADSSNDFVATQNKEVATLEENIFSEGNLEQNPSSSQGVQNVRRCLLNIVVSMSWLVFQLDVNNAFLYGDLEEGVYRKLPEGYFPSDNKSKSDYSLYTESDKGVFLALLVYVDDIIITGNSVFEIEKFKVFLKFKFMIKDLGYQKLMEKLIYLTNIRLDISYVVHCLSQFMHSTLTSHLQVAFKIFRYLKSYPGLGVHITKTSSMFLTAYSDAD
nr:hypothetical protein [Tanacetum cinerariifolium]